MTISHDKIIQIVDIGSLNGNLQSHGMKPSNVYNVQITPMEISLGSEKVDERSQKGAWKRILQHVANEAGILQYSPYNRLYQQRQGMYCCTFIVAVRYIIKSFIIIIFRPKTHSLLKWHTYFSNLLFIDSRMNIHNETLLTQYRVFA